MGNVAFELAEEYAGTVDRKTPDGSEETVDKFQGGVIALPPEGHSFDLKEELTKGGGLIVVDEQNTALTDTLERLPVLKRVAAPEGAEAISAYQSMSATKLREVAKGRELELGGARSKEALIELLEAHDAARLAGDANPDPDAESSEGSGEEG